MCNTQADLTGIKWCKFKNNEEICTVELLTDPVLEAFTRCIHADVLCVWQRSKKTGNMTFSVYQL